MQIKTSAIKLSQFGKTFHEQKKNLSKKKLKQMTILTSGTDWTGPKRDGPAIGSVESVGSDDIGLVIPLLVAINPLDVDVHVDVVVALQSQKFKVSEEFSGFKFIIKIVAFCSLYLPSTAGRSVSRCRTIPIPDLNLQSDSKVIVKWLVKNTKKKNLWI